MNEELIKKANDIFKKRVENTEDLESFIIGCGLSACHFAMEFITPQEDQDTYNAIYFIYYNFFEELEKNLSKKLDKNEK